MTQRLSTEELEHLAQKRAGAKLAFFAHLAVYLCVNAFLLARSDVGFGTRPWSAGPLFGWGLGVLLHGVSVFVLGGGSSMRERMVQRERERLQREQDRLP
jgi:hypothetical protein